MEMLEFRPAEWYRWLGVALIVVGIWAVSAPAYHLLTGSPWWITSRRNPTDHLASHAETVFYSVFYLVPVVIGALMVVGSFTQSVTLGPEEIVVRRIGGAVAFQVRYDVLEPMKRTQGTRGTDRFILTGAGRSIALPHIYRDFYPMIQELIRRAPQIWPQAD